MFGFNGLGCLVVTERTPEIQKTCGGWLRASGLHDAVQVLALFNDYLTKAPGRLVGGAGSRGLGFAVKRFRVQG